MMSRAAMNALLVIAQAAGAHLLPSVDRLAGALLAAVWEGAVLAGAVALALRLVPGLSPALRARLWLAVLAVLVVLPALSFVLPPAVAHPAGLVAVHPLQVRAVWSLWLVCAWAVLSLARAVKLAAGAQRLRRIVRAATPVDPGAENDVLLRNGGQRVELCLSAETGRPSVVGFSRPRILLPPALYHALSPDELRQVLLHEMEHLRRHDDWTNLAQKLALVLLPLDPALFWVERRLCAERELACDDGVLRTTVAHKAYAACLVSLAEHAMLQRGAALALGAWERQSELARRVRRILRRPEPALRPAAARLAVGGVLGGLLAGGALLASSPQLIRFAPDPTVTMASTELPEHEAGMVGDRLTGPGLVTSRQVKMQPVAAQETGGQNHVTLASATLPLRPGARDGHLVVALRSGTTLPATNPVRRVIAMQAGLPRQVSSLRQVGMPQTVSSLRQIGSPRKVSYRAHAAQPRMVLLTAWPPAEQVLTLRVNTNVFDAGGDEFSPSYAAVPMQGGWLLVQL